VKPKHPLLDSRLAFGTILTPELAVARCLGLAGKAQKNCRLWNKFMKTGSVFFMSGDALDAFKQKKEYSNF
jgi:hypothetical protein